MVGASNTNAKTRLSVADGAHLTELATLHLLNNATLSVASGLLISTHKDGQSNRHDAVTELHDHAQPSGSSIRELPPGRPISHKLPPESVGDVFQIWEFLVRFAEIIGLKEVPSYEQLEDELVDPWPICANQKETLSKGTQHGRDYSSPMSSPANVSISHSNGESGLSSNEDMASVFIPVETSSMKETGQDKLASQTLGRCTGVVLPGVHLALFKVIFSELLSKLAIFVDSNSDPKESKPRRGRKKDTESVILTKEFNFDMLSANKLTWPELARRYMLAISSINGCMDLSDISSREGVKLYRCLQGDGGILCGAVLGVAGMEKEALLLLEAENLICSSPSSEGNNVFMMDYKYTDVIDCAEVPIANNRTLPNWAEPLELVRKLPTNVGTRIRKCVYKALERTPPEWARKILEHSISKEVFKANASGRTKKAVLSVLSEAPHVIVPQKQENPRNERKSICISEAILKKCRIALRHAISSTQEPKFFGNLLATTLMNSNENEDEGILGFPGMVSRPLDFRTIDIRLAMGAYRGSWETFYEDVQEVFRNLHAAFADRTDVLEMVVAFSQSFESLYKTEVLDLVQKFHCYLSNGNTGGSEIQEELHDILTAATNLPKAPWEDSVCKVCGIDRDDDSVLLCDEDECKSGYHTYCLNPPLALIPRGNWYCPPHMPDEEEEESHLDQGVQDLHLDPGVQDSKRQRKGAESHVYYDTLVKLAAAMEKKEYWELSTQERIDMLKFLCDEMLNTVLIRQHIEQCPDKLKDLQQKFHTLNFELKDLKYKEETRTSFATPLSTLGGELPDENASTSQDNLKTSLEQAADNGEMDTLSDEISKVQESIGTVVSQLNKASLRREFLGKDSLGRLYWVLGRSGKRPLLVADGSMLIRKEGDIDMVNSYPPSVFDCKGWNSASVVCYESDEEIRSLVDWLREYDPREKELKHAIQQWQWQWQQRHLYHLGNFDLSDPPVSKGSSDNEQQQQLMDLPSTKAAAILEKTCRCDCLEPIWPARHHCVACHETYFTSTEYEEHAGKCSGHATEKDSVDPAGSSGKLNSCPYDFEEICRKFITNDSNKEVVKDIGLIGSNGVPSFVPSPAYLDEPAAVILNKNKTDDTPKLGEEESSKSAQNFPGSSVGDENESKSKKPAPESDTTSCEEEASCAPTRLLSVNGGLVPESSLRPVTGRKSHIPKQQKINLLDMDAALPEGALRASKSQQTRRRSWRAFVKRAESISEMILATSLLESTIKSEFLKKDWWYWSSFTVAMKTSTVSSLALRIHTLDNCIMYTKEPRTITVPADSAKVVKKGRKRKEPGPSVS